MTLARATAGGVLRRLAGGPEARRCSAAAATTTTTATLLPRPTTRSTRLSLLPPTSSTTTLSPYIQSTLFHTSAPRAARRRRRFNSVPAAKMGLIDEDAVSKFTKEQFPEYTDKEKKQLQSKYTRAQNAAVEAGEAAVDPRDLTVQGRLRLDALTAGINYVDDFSQMQPGVDKRHKSPVLAANMAADAKFMNLEQVEEHTLDWLKSYYVESEKDVGKSAVDMTRKERERAARRESGDGPGFEDYLEHLNTEPTLLHRDGKTRVSLEETGNSNLAPVLPRYIAGVSGPRMKELDLAAAEKQKKKKALAEQGQINTNTIRDGDIESKALELRDITDGTSPDEPETAADLKRRTGLTSTDLTQLIVKVVVYRMVSNQTRLGKIPSHSVMSIVGNGNGRLGLGIAKSTEFQTAKNKSREMALRNIQPIPRYENRTIYGNVEVKVSGTIVQLSARPPGFGLRVPHRIFEMARAAGIKDLAAKIPRSRNPMNSVKATFEALMKQPDPEQIAAGRGKKLVDVRKVYYGGSVY